MFEDKGVLGWIIKQMVSQQIFKITQIFIWILNYLLGTSTNFLRVGIYLPSEAAINANTMSFRM